MTNKPHTESSPHVGEAAATNLKTVQALDEVLKELRSINSHLEALIEQMKREQEAQPTSEAPAAKAVRNLAAHALMYLQEKQYGFVESALHQILDAVDETSPTAGAAGVPQGWKLVPLEATEAMLDALNDHRGAWQDNYRAMLAAAPGVPQEPSASVPLTEIPDSELPGMWERADFIGGQDEVRAAPKVPQEPSADGVRPVEAPSLLTHEEVHAALPAPTTSGEFHGGMNVQMAWHHFNEWAENIQRAVLAKNAHGVSAFSGNTKPPSDADGQPLEPSAAGMPSVVEAAADHQRNGDTK